MARGRRLGRKRRTINDDEQELAEMAYKVMACDQQLVAALADAPNPESNSRVAERVHNIWNITTQSPPHPQVVSNFFLWVGLPRNRDSLPSLLHEILKKRRSQLQRMYSRKRRLIKLSNLNSGTVNKEAFLSRIPTRFCSRLPVPFPPPLLYVSETDDIFDRNMAFILERDLPDSRIPRKFIFHLNHPESWSDSNGGLLHDLGTDEGGQFVDSDGELVAVVIRNACEDKRIIGFADGAVKGAVATRRNARKEDRGHISQMGLSAGSRSNPSLGWVRNIERQKKNVELHKQVNYDCSSSFAVLWSLARSLLPDTIIQDFDAFIEKLGPDLRMDADRTMETSSTGQGAYHIQMKDWDFKFHNAELAPPCGVVAENYCRYIHFERQPHTWAISLTTSRSFDPALSSLEAGGHFYISSYGIRVQAAPNTLIAWRPRDWHGTSLFRISADAESTEKHYFQRGLCIVTGTRVIKAVKDWRAGKLGAEELDCMESEVEDDHEQDSDARSREIDCFVKDLQGAPLRRSARLAAKPKKSWATC